MLLLKLCKRDLIPVRKFSTQDTLKKVSEILDSGPSFNDFLGANDGVLNLSDLNELKASDLKASREPQRGEFPRWLRTGVPMGESYTKLKNDLRKLKLNTVCEEARCPNIGECWGGPKGTATATVMLMGSECTRACRFCSVKTSKTPKPLRDSEPEDVAEAISLWGLSYVVLTSVDRDDLADFGASHFAKTISLIKQKASKIYVECLTGDFQGRMEHVDQVVNSGPDVYAHNIETVRNLQKMVRDRRAGFDQSLSVLLRAKSANPDILTKSSIMLGLGETDEEVQSALEELRRANVDIVTLGQYMRPSLKHMKVVEYVHKDKFSYWQKVGEEMGFKYVASGPLVRSSYKAGEFYVKNILDKRGLQGA